MSPRCPMSLRGHGLGVLSFEQILNLNYLYLVFDVHSIIIYIIWLTLLELNIVGLLVG